MILVYHCVFKVLIVVDDSVFCLSIFLFFTVIRDSETHNDMNNNQKKNEW